MLDESMVTETVSRNNQHELEATEGGAASIWMCISRLRLMKRMQGRRKLRFKVKDREIAVFFTFCSSSWVSLLLTSLRTWSCQGHS
jgi:hypothetical protein